MDGVAEDVVNVAVNVTGGNEEEEEEEEEEHCWWDRRVSVGHECFHP